MAADKLRSLDTTPARTDMTDRECSKLLGSIFAGLAGLTPDVATVRRAVRWWAEQDDAWEMMATQQKAIDKVMGIER